MTDQTPGQKAAQDQVHTALSGLIADELASKIAAYHGAELHQSTTVSDAMVERFRTWLRSGPTQCPHSPMKRRAAYWLAHQPCLYCMSCVNAVAAETRGTEEDRRCDVCGVVQEPAPDCITAGSVIYAVEGADFYIAPIAICFGLCRSCDDRTTESWILRAETMKVDHGTASPE